MVDELTSQPPGSVAGPISLSLLFRTMLLNFIVGLVVSKRSSEKYKRKNVIYIA